MATRLAYSFSKNSHKRTNFVTPNARFFSKKATAQQFVVPEALSKWPSTHVTKLGNGLTVATEEGSGDLATLGVYIQVGSGFEEVGHTGAAQLLARAALRGTNKRTQSQLESDIDSIGGQLRASSSRQQTSYQTSVLKQDVPKAVELLGDILTNPSLNDQALEKEKEAVLGDLKEISNNHNAVVLDHLHSIAFQGTTFGNSIFGPKENLKSFKRHDLLQYLKSNYTGGKIVLVGTGAVKHADLVKLAGQHLGLIQHSSFTEGAPTVRYTGSQVTVWDEEKPNVHAAFGLPAVGWTHPDYNAFRILQTLLGSWSVESGTDLKSHLAEILNTEKLAQSFKSFYLPYPGIGLFGVQTVNLGGQLQDLPYQIYNEIVRLSQQASDSEVALAKRQLLSSILKQLGSPAAVNSQIGSQLLFQGKRVAPAEEFQTIAGIDAVSVRKAADEHLYDTDPALVAFGSHLEDLPDYNQTRGYTYWRTL
eukprot:TRINITY_DN2604_c0_g1_i1.p1 TRINITY_DN2604_c0_g1~~TRINITY_DN2604_c0_g1_i1.p1  ORF type:complete len:511 (-),score=189.91 TRINITY_DN2604_c0_g1_i1:312-1742(-)